MRIATLREASADAGFAPVLLNPAFSVPSSADSAILATSDDGSPVCVSVAGGPWILALDSLPALPGAETAPNGYRLIDHCPLTGGMIGEGRFTALAVASARFARGEGWRGTIHGHAADFEYANFRDADLRCSDFREAVVRNVRFNGARLAASVFVRADCAGADFTGADLRDADFRQADLRGANFSRATVRGANFTGACWDESTRWPDPMEFLRAYHRSAVVSDAECRIPDDCIRQWGPTDECDSYRVGSVQNARLQFADAMAHPFPDAFRRWRESDSAPCPYGNAIVDRPFTFPERREAREPDTGADESRAVWLAFRDMLRLALAFVKRPGSRSPAIQPEDEYGDPDDGPDYLALPDSLHPIDAVLCPAIEDWEANPEREYDVTVERTFTVTERGYATVTARSEDDAREMVSGDPGDYVCDWEEVDRDFDSEEVTDVTES